MATLDQVMKDFDDAMMHGFMRGIDELHDEAVRQSSGPLDEAELARMDHPFATRHGSPPINPDPAVINVQSGQFREEWKQSPVERIREGSSFDLESSVYNDSPVADFLKYGTEKMFNRPIEEEIGARAEDLMTPFIEDALQQFADTLYTLTG